MIPHYVKYIPHAPYERLWEYPQMEDSLAARLSALMQQNNMSARALSLAAGMNATAVRDILSGRSKSPRWFTLMRLAQALSVSVRDLVGQDEYEKLVVEYNVVEQPPISAAYAHLPPDEDSNAGRQNPGFRGAYLRGANLRNGVFPGVDFSGADLRAADFSNAVLRGAIFVHANLSYATLYGADLTGADLTGAQLEGATILGAKLSGTKLDDAEHPLLQGDEASPSEDDRG